MSWIDVNNVRRNAWFWNWKGEVDLKLMHAFKASDRIESDRIHCIRWMSLSQYYLAYGLKKNISLFFPQSYEYEVNPRYRTKSKMNNRRANEKFCSRFVIFIESKFSINREVILRTFIWAHCLDDATIQHRLRRFRMVDKKSRLTHTY